MDKFCEYVKTLDYSAQRLRVPIGLGASSHFTRTRQNSRLPKRRIALKMKTMDKVQKEKTVSLGQFTAQLLRKEKNLREQT